MRRLSIPRSDSGQVTTAGWGRANHLENSTLSIDTSPPQTEDHPPQGPRNPKAELKAAKAYAKATRPWYKKKRWWAAGLLLHHHHRVGGRRSQLGRLQPTASANTSQDSQSEKPAAQEKPAAEEKPEMTSGQKNALESAQNYIDMSGFSKAGLIQQLSSSAGEGYSKADATFAANHVDANWNKEAVEAAKNYLDIDADSKAG